MLEKSLEKKLVKAVKNNGGLCLKFFSMSFTGMPDRIVLLPQGKMGFVEVKRSPTHKPTRRQTFVHQLLRRLGFFVFVLQEEDEIETIINFIKGNY